MAWPGGPAGLAHGRPATAFTPLPTYSLYIYPHYKKRTLLQHRNFVSIGPISSQLLHMRHKWLCCSM